MAIAAAMSAHERSSFDPSPTPLLCNAEGTLNRQPKRHSIGRRASGFWLHNIIDERLTLLILLSIFSQKVVWKVSLSDIDANFRAEFAAVTGAAPNLRLLPWLPQNDLLGHPAVVAFLSHGGIHSMYEAIYHAVPMVMVPLTADQFDNAR